MIVKTNCHDDACASQTWHVEVVPARRVILEVCRVCVRHRCPELRTAAAPLLRWVTRHHLDLLNDPRPHACKIRRAISLVRSHTMLIIQTYLLTIRTCSLGSCGPLPAGRSLVHPEHSEALASKFSRPPRRPAACRSIVDYVTPANCPIAAAELTYAASLAASHTMQSWPLTLLVSQGIKTLPDLLVT